MMTVPVPGRHDSSSTGTRGIHLPGCLNPHEPVNLVRRKFQISQERRKEGRKVQISQEGRKEFKQSGYNFKKSSDQA